MSSEPAKPVQRERDLRPQRHLSTQTLNGQKSSRTWDDEDRLTSVTLPDGHTDSFSYNGLGMRLTKNDPAGK